MFPVVASIEDHFPRKPDNYQAGVALAAGKTKVFAGAGSGKTTSMVARISFLIKERNVRPDSFLVITFSRDAKEALRNKILDVVGPSARRMAVSTIHGFCRRMLINWKTPEGRLIEKGKFEQGQERALSSILEILEKEYGSGFMSEMDLKAGQIALAFSRWEGNEVSPLDVYKQHERDIRALLDLRARYGAEDIDLDDLISSYDRDQFSNPEMWAAYIYNLWAVMRKANEGWAWLPTAPVSLQAKLANGSWDYTARQVIKAPSVTFSDMQTAALHYLRTNQSALRYVQRFSHVILDEAQDINLVQKNLFVLLTDHIKPNDPMRSAMAVGDDAQAIYGFRGSKPEHLLDLSSEDWSTLLMENNYRSTAAIVNAFSGIVQIHNTKQMEKTAYAAGPNAEKTGVMEMHRTADHDQAAQAVIQRIVDEALTDRAKNGGENFDRFAVLTRTNDELGAFEVELIQQGIPYEMRGGTTFFNRREVRAVLSYFLLALGPSVVGGNLGEVFSDAMTMPSRYGLSPYSKDGGRLLHSSAKAMPDPESAFRHGQLDRIIDDDRARFKMRESLNRVLADIQAVRAKIESGASSNEVMNFILDNVREFKWNFSARSPEVGRTLREWIHAQQRKSVDDEDDSSEQEDSSGESEDRPEAEELEIGFAKLLFRMSESERRPNERMSPDQPLGLLDRLRAMKQNADTSKTVASKIGRVVLMTAHRSKGLEWDTVFVNAPGGVFPSDFATDEEREEDRRLFYVACTRAERNLILTCPDVNHRGKPGGPSPFIAESEFYRYMTGGNAESPFRYHTLDDAIQAISDTEPSLIPELERVRGLMLHDTRLMPDFLAEFREAMAGNARLASIVRSVRDIPIAFAHEDRRMRLAFGDVEDVPAPTAPVLDMNSVIESAEDAIRVTRILLAQKKGREENLTSDQRERVAKIAGRGIWEKARKLHSGEGSWGPLTCDVYKNYFNGQISTYINTTLSVEELLILNKPAQKTNPLDFWPSDEQIAEQLDSVSERFPDGGQAGTLSSEAYYRDRIITVLVNHGLDDLTFPEDKFDRSGLGRAVVGLLNEGRIERAPESDDPYSKRTLYRLAGEDDESSKTRPTPDKIERYAHFASLVTASDPIDRNIERSDMPPEVRKAWEKERKTIGKGDVATALLKDGTIVHMGRDFQAMNRLIPAGEAIRRTTEGVYFYIESDEANGMARLGLSDRDILDAIRLINVKSLFIIERSRKGRAEKGKAPIENTTQVDVFDPNAVQIRQPLDHEHLEAVRMIEAGGSGVPSLAQPRFVAVGRGTGSKDDNLMLGALAAVVDRERYRVWLNVADNYRRYGIGGKLIRAAKEEFLRLAKTYEGMVMDAYVRQDEAAGLAAFLKAFGFQRQKRSEANEVHFVFNPNGVKVGKLDDLEADTTILTDLLFTQIDLPLPSKADADHPFEVEIGYDADDLDGVEVRSPYYTLQVSDSDFDMNELRETLSDKLGVNVEFGTGRGQFRVILPEAKPAAKKPKRKVVVVPETKSKPNKIEPKTKKPDPRPAKKTEPKKPEPKTYTTPDTNDWTEPMNPRALDLGPRLRIDGREYVMINRDHFDEGDDEDRRFLSNDWDSRIFVSPVDSRGRPQNTQESFLVAKNGQLQNVNGDWVDYTVLQVAGHHVKIGEGQTRQVYVDDRFIQNLRLIPNIRLSSAGAGDYEANVQGTRIFFSIPPTPMTYEGFEGIPRRMHDTRKGSHVRQILRLLRDRGYTVEVSAV